MSQIQSFSVIVPAYNCAEVVTKTLDSILESINFFKQNYPLSQEIQGEIIVVNDVSTDNTLAVLQAFSDQNADVKIVSHETNRGAGAARNTGVKNSQGELLFFCDGDDLFLPEHIYICLMLFIGKTGEASSFKVVSDNYDININFPTQHFDCLETGVKTEDKLHPYWKDAIENSIPLNLCVKRECHEFIEGFPEGEVYQKVRTEDIAYNIYLKQFYKVAKINLDTVEYVRYPGNIFDQQIEKFKLPPDKYYGKPHLDINLVKEAEKLQQEKLRYLQKKQYTSDCQAKGYHFSQDWFSGNIPSWQQVLHKFTHLPHLQFLEIGSWQGRSTCWLLDNILTHGSARITCIDTFKGSVEHESQSQFQSHLKSLESVFDFNIAQTGTPEKVDKKVGKSQEILRFLPLNNYDFVYIDGSHLAPDVLEDIILSWRLLKVNGIIIFDDYGWSMFKEKPTKHPKLAIDSFLAVFKDKLKVIHRGYQVIVEKIQN